MPKQKCTSPESILNCVACIVYHCTLTFASEETKELLENKNRPDILQHIFSKRSVVFFLRLINYDGNKKTYLKRFYEFEKSLNVDLNMEFLWLNIFYNSIFPKYVAGITI